MSEIVRLSMIKKGASLGKRHKACLCVGRSKNVFIRRLEKGWENQNNRSFGEALKVNYLNFIMGSNNG